MSKSNERVYALNLLSARLGLTRKILAADYVVDIDGPAAIFLDPNGIDRNVTLPPFLPGGGTLAFIAHVGAGNLLLLKAASGAEIARLEAGDSCFLVASEQEWRAHIANNITTFGPAGVGHSKGMVPDPGAVAGLLRFLADDGTWKSVTSAGIVDAYKQISDGTNVAVASGLSQLRIRSSDSTITPVVANNDPTYGDVLDLIVNGGALNHNTLLNYVANQHIDHSAVSITAGSGLSGGGAITASRTLALDVNNLVADTPVLADSFPFYDASGVDTNKATLSVLNGILDHNALLNFVTNKHIDHTLVSIQAGTGLAGGGDISTTRTLNLDINSLSADALAVGDFFVFYDISGADHNKVTLASLNAALDHNSLLNYVANQHIDHSTVSISAGAGLSGGGTIAASRSLALDINGQTVDNTPDITADYVITYDTSAAGFKKVLLNKIGGVQSVAGRTGAITLAVADVSGAAPLASPAFSGVPTAPTAAARTNTTQLATTAYVDSATRTKLSANRTYYVRTDGNDSNTGLTNTAGGAFLTLQHAFDYVRDNIDLNGFTITIQGVATMTYTSGISLGTRLTGDGARFVGAGSLVLDLAGGTLQCTSADCVTVVGADTPQLIVQNLTLVSVTSGNHLWATYGGRICIGNGVVFGAAPGSTQILAQYKGHIHAAFVNYSITGGATQHIYVDADGQFLQLGGTVTLTGTPAFSTAFLVVQSGGRFDSGGITYSGAATGPRFKFINPGRINTEGSATNGNYFPGNSAGLWTNIDQYMQPSSGLDFITTLNANNSASLIFTTMDSNKYAGYVFVIQNLLPVTNNVSALLTVSTDGGASYLAANYKWSRFDSSAGGSGGGASNSDSSCTWGVIIGNTQGGMSGTMNVQNNSNGVAQGFNYNGVFSDQDPTNFNVHMAAGTNTTASVINAIKFLMSSGNIASGAIHCYGVRKYG